MLLVSCCFLLLAALKLNLPGYQSDEGFYTVPAIQLLQKHQVEDENWFSIRLGDLKLPVMRAPYFGGTQVCLLVPFLKVFGTDFKSSRLMPIFFAFLCIWLTWWLCEMLFNWRVALMAAALTSFNASYILWSRVGLVGEGPVLVFFSLLTLILLARWYYNREPFSLYCAAFILGLGLYTKINFLFIICGIIVAGAVLWKLLAARFRGAAAPLAIFFFLLGASPMLYYIFTDHFVTFNIVLQSILNPTFSGVDNWDFVANCTLRGKQFISMLGGSAYYTAAMKTPNPVYACVFLAAYLYLAYAVVTRRGGIARGGCVKLLLVMEAVLFAGNCFTTGSFNNFHLYIIYPFPFITIALFLDQASNHFRGFKTLFLAVFISAFVFVDIYLLFQKYDYMERIGERAEWSDAIYEVADYLVRNNIHHPVVLDNTAYTTRYNIQVLTGGDIMPLFLASSDKLFARTIKEVISDKSRYYLVFVPPYGYHENRVSPAKSFAALIKNEKRALRLVKTFANRDNEPIFNLYAAERASLRSVAR